MLDCIETGFPSSLHVVAGRQSFQLLQVLLDRLQRAIDIAKQKPWWDHLGASFVAPSIMVIENSVCSLMFVRLSVCLFAFVF